MTIPLPTITNPEKGWEYAHVPEFFSISTLVSFRRCARLYFYSYMCDLKQAREHPALRFGAAIHAALPELSVGEPTTRLSRSLERFKAAWGDGDAEYVDEKRNSFNANRILLSYSLAGGIGGGLFELVDPPTQHALKMGVDTSPWEVPFGYYLGDLPVPIIGRVDGIVRHRQTGELYALERKTASRQSTMLLDNFRRNPQSMGYPYALRLMGIPVVGTVMETIGVPNPGKTARANPKYETTVTTIPIPQHFLDEFALWAYETGQEILARFQTKNMPKDSSACASYSQFGEPGFPCKYMNLCEPEDWTILKPTFKIDPYDPFEVDHVKLEEITKQRAGLTPDLPQVLPRFMFEQGEGQPASFRCDELPAHMFA